MSANKIVIFLQDLVKSWDQRTSACLARMVYALLQGKRLGVAALGRYLPTTTTDKHHIKAVDRFLKNQKVDLVLLWSALCGLLLGGQSRWFVLLDWTDLHDGQHEVLVAAVSFGGRSLPIAWTTWKKGWYHKSRNAVETSFCLLIKSLLPLGVDLCIVADRGFCRSSFLKAMARAKISYILRMKKDIHILNQRGHGPVKNRSIARGQIRDLGDVFFGADAKVPLRCVLTFLRGTGKNIPKEPWYLVTNLSIDELTANGVIAAYKRRMRIEHAFRDHKSLRFGFQLRSVCLSSPQRYDNLWAISTLALLLLVLVGATVEQQGLHRGFKANTSKDRTHSLFQLGLVFLHRLRFQRIPLRMLTICLDLPLEGIG